MTVQKLTLESGRSLDYLVSGSTAKDAALFIYIHGTPRSYPVMSSLVEKSKEANFKLVSFSRAGYGDSSRNHGRSIIDIVEDVKALKNHLGYEECFVGGWSGGGECPISPVEISQS